MPYFCRKLGKMSQNLLSAAVVIGALKVRFSHVKMHLYLSQPDKNPKSLFDDVIYCIFFS